MDHSFIGKVAWAKVFIPDQKFNKYSLDFYCTDADRKAIKALGTRLTLREDDTGFFYKFSRDPEHRKSPGKPEVVGPDDQPWDKPIGNGSTVEATIETYKWQSPAHGEGTGCFLKRVKVLEHVVYEKPNTQTQPAAQPEPELPVEKPAASKPKGKGPF